MKGLLLFAAVTTAASQFLSTGASFKINEVDYFVSPYSQGNVVDGPVVHESLTQAFGFAPVTVVADDVDNASLGGMFSNWTTKDDVWQSGFLSAVFLANHKGNCISKQSLYNGADPSIIFPLTKNLTIPSGPYFLHLSSGELYQAFRLYRDVVQAFSASLLQNPAGSSFQPLSAQVPASDALTIGVPSRLYFKPSAEKPLAGVRVGIKELYDLAGMRKSNGNRAWWRLYPEANATAPCVQNLIDAGAIIIGYQKLSQFANGESPTADWVDYHSPFNPRGDGYNSPSSSSSGAAASIASYEWLDIALGSDTGGSIRVPAGVQGIFGNRPSKDLVTLDGAMPLSPTLDTPGFLTRDPEIWDAANKAMYGKNYTSYGSLNVKYPSKIYTYGFASAQPLISEFADKLAAFVGSRGPEALDLNAAWNETGPGSDSLSVMLGETYPALIGIEQIKLVRDPFYKDYAAAYEGRRPFVNPVPLARWAYAEALPKGSYEAALRNKTTFMEWFNSKILPRSDDWAQCSQSILLYPSSNGVPNPRNKYLAAPGAPTGFSSGRISVFAEVPDSVFPLGEVATNSSITGQDELLPVAVSLLVAKGCDGLLARLAKDLVQEGVLKIPLAGRTLEGGEILLRRDGW